MPTRVAVVGAGNISRHHFESLEDLGEAVDVVGIADLKEEARTGAAARMDCPAFEDSTQMLDEVEPEAVFLLAPLFARGDFEIEAAKRGIHLFVEKPVALDLETAEAIEAAVDSADIVSSVGYQWRYSDFTRKAEQFTSGSTIGMASGHWSGVFPEVDWWGSRSKSGGQVVEQTTHIFDLCRYFLGEPISVYARHARTAANPPDGADVPDVGVAVVEFESGTIAQISSSCLLPADYRVDIALLTEAGVAEISKAHLRIIEKGSVTTLTDPGRPFLEEAKAFIRAAQVGDASNVLSPYGDAVKTLRLTLAAVESADTGNVVKLGELLD